MDPFVLHRLIEMGAAVTPRDLADRASLTALVLTFRAAPAWPPGAWKAFRTSAKTPRDLLAALYGGQVPKEPTAARRPTLLQSGHIQSVTIKQAGDKASGVVAFKAEGAYEGVVRYEAQHTAGAWAITAFEFPAYGARLEGKARSWKLTKVPVASASDLPVIRSGGVDVPGTPRVTVRLHADGTAGIDGTTFDIAADDPVQADRAIQQLRQQLKAMVDASPKEPDASSKINLILVADATAKWRYAQWIAQCAATAWIYRIHFAVQRQGERDAVVLETLLPKDRGFSATSDFPAEELKVKIKLFRRNLHQSMADQYTLVRVDSTHSWHLPKGWPASRGDAEARALHGKVLDKVAQTVLVKVKSMGGDVSGEIVAPPPKGGAVPCEDVLNMVAILKRAGVSVITFEGSAMPLTRHEREELREKK